MALSSFLRGFWDDPWEGMSEPSRLFDQHFGGLLPEDCLRPYRAYPSAYGPLVLRARMQPPRQTGVSEVVNNDKEFKVCMDVQHFQPEEIQIKTKDNHLIISASHEERPDEHGFIKREFTRQYILPKDVNPSTVKSSLSREGVLTLKAPKMALEAPKEHTIPITHEKEGEQ